MAGAPGRAAVQEVAANPGADAFPDLNDRGQVVWQHWHNSGFEIRMWDGGTTRTLTEDGARGTLPRINNRGQVLWTGADDSGPAFFRWDGGIVRKVTGIPGPIWFATSHTFEANEAGQIVWQSVGPRGRAAVLLWDGSAVRELVAEPLEGYFPQINDRGEIVWQLSGSGAGVFLASGPGVRQLTRPGAGGGLPQLNAAGQVAWASAGGIHIWDGTSARQIAPHSGENWWLRLNTRGQVVWHDWDGRDYEIYFWDGAAVRQLTDNSTDDRYPEINDGGQVVWGSADTAGGLFRRLFLWTGTAVLPLVEGRESVFPYRMNRAGQVVWQERSATGGGIFLYTPDPVPHTVILNPAPVAGGKATTGTVLLRAPAPAGGVPVTLVSGDAAAVTVPAGVTVPTGATAARFPVTTARVTAPREVTLSASAAGVTAAGALTLLPDGVFLTVSPGSVPGGSPATGVLLLSDPAPAGGARVLLSSSAPATASVPGEVLIPAGATLAMFPIGTAPVAGVTRVELAATFSGVTRTGSLEVMPPTLSGVTLEASSVPGGLPVVGRVTLSGPAPAGGAPVTLTSSDPPAATLPASVTVPAGAAAASFTVSTRPVTAARPVTITAAYGATRSAALEVRPPGVAAFRLNPFAVTGGATATGTVTLNAPAPAGGATVQIRSDDPTAARVHFIVSVPAGATTASVTIETPAVAEARTVRIWAFGPDPTVRSDTLTVLPAGATALVLNPAAVRGGEPATGTLLLGRPAPAGGTVVTLSSEAPAVAAAPASVTAPAGASSVTFPVTTVPVAASSSVRITAASSAGTASASLHVSPPALQALEVGPARVTGGRAAIGTARLSGPAPAGGFRVALSSSDAAVAATPASVTIPEGATAATFPVTTAAVTDEEAVTISAVTPGAARTHPLSVLPPAIAALAFHPAPVPGGTPTTGTVTLREPAPEGGALVRLASDHLAGAWTAPTVTVTAGATTASFAVTTYGVPAPVDVTFTAAYGDETRAATLRVWDAGPVHLALRPDRVPGGAAATATVTLSQPAPAGGAAVALSSSNPAVARAPASVFVPAGASTGHAAVPTAAVAAPASSVLTASYGGGTEAATLTALPLSPPERPLGLAVSATGITEYTLSWTDQSLSESGFEIERKAEGGAFARVGSAGANASRFVDRGLSSNTHYTYRVRAVNASGASAWSNEASGPRLPTLLLSVALDASRVTGGEAVTGTATINGPAPPEGVTIFLSSDTPAVAATPRSAIVAGGTSSVSFKVTTSVVARESTVTISAFHNGWIRTAELVVMPPPPAPVIVRGIAVFRPATREWFARGPDESLTHAQFGGPEDVPVPGDYFGTGRPQIAVLRLPTREWLLRTEDGGTVGPVPFGGPEDLPVPGDYFGLGRASLAVFRPSTREWFLRRDDGSAVPVAFGGPGDVPVPADYVGLGRAQIAVYRPETGAWFLRMDNGSTVRIPWGGPGDVPVPADYSGARRAQIAVFRPATREWFLRDDLGRATVVAFGGPGDVPVPGDYLGLGRAQVAVFRPATAEWFLRRDDGSTVRIQWGAPGDVPVAGGWR